MGLINQNDITLDTDLVEGCHGYDKSGDFDKYQLQRVVELERFLKKTGAMDTLAAAPKGTILLGMAYLDEIGESRNFGNFWHDVAERRYGLLGHESVLLPHLSNIEVRLLVTTREWDFAEEYLFLYGTDKEATIEALQQCCDTVTADPWTDWSVSKLTSSYLLDLLGLGAKIKANQASHSPLKVKMLLVTCLVTCKSHSRRYGVAAAT
jgi:hypothetical protein